MTSKNLAARLARLSILKIENFTFHILEIVLSIIEYLYKIVEYLKFVKYKNLVIIFK